jgi:hypothetical protein
MKSKPTVPATIVIKYPNLLPSIGLSPITSNLVAIGTSILLLTSQPCPVLANSNSPDMIGKLQQLQQVFNFNTS